MNALIKRVLIGAATLAIASAPLAASAQQNWHQDGNMRGHVEMHRGYGHPQYHRYYEGYYGYAPGGFHGYYHNGRWFHHRRQQAGVFIYF